MNGKRRTRRIGLALALVFSGSLHAQHQWTGDLSDDWFDAGNWVGGEVPGPGGGPLTNVQINMLAPNPAVIDGQAGESGWLAVGFSASGSLTLTNAGSLVSASATIGQSGTAGGIVRVSGVGSAWTVGGSYFEIGNHGSGELVIENGGQVHSSGLGAFGRHGTSSGSVTVAGAGSVWHGSSMYVGWTGSGELTISDGGQVFCNSVGAASSANCSIGFNPSGQGQVMLSGQDSLLQTDKGFVQIGGNSGSGSLLLSDQATLAVLGTGSSDGVVRLARFGSATGTLTVGAPAGEPPGVPGQIDARTFIFGEGNGQAVFNHSGAMTIPANVIGPIGSGTAQLSFLAGTTLFDGQPDIFNGEDFDYSGPTTVAAGAAFGAAGNFGDITNHGTLVPGGVGIGNMAIDGDYIHGAGAGLAVKVGAGGVSSFIHVSGAADLQGGTVAVTLVPGQPPQEGLHPILTADGGIAGQFDDVAPASGGFALVQIGDTVYLDVSDRLFSDRFEND